MALGDRMIFAFAAMAALIVAPQVPAMAQDVEPIAALMADADANKGKRLVIRCRACHDVSADAANRVGPPLWNVVNREKASAPDYEYSEAFAALDGVWDYESLNAFLANPKVNVPGTKMDKFPGVAEVQDRANLVAFLRTLADEPAPLPAAALPTEPVWRADAPQRVTRPHG